MNKKVQRNLQKNIFIEFKFINIQKLFYMLATNTTKMEVKMMLLK